MSDQLGDTERLADMVFQSVRVYVHRHVAQAISAAVNPALERLAIAEKRLAEAPAPAPSPLTPEEVAALVRDAFAEELPPLAERIAATEKTLTEAPVPLTAERVKELTEAAIAAIEIVVPEADPGPPGPAGEPGPAGKDGATGLPGPAGKDGKDAAVDYAAIEETVSKECARLGLSLNHTLSEMVPDQVKAAVDAIPRPTDGRDGRDGEAGQPGAPGLDGMNGADGAPGADGFSLEDIDIAIREDGRTIEFKFVRGDVVKTREVVIPWPVDRGVFKPGEAADYARGDGVSYKGCWWLAQEPTRDVPGTTKAWRLAVKAGRDGKDLRPDEKPVLEPLRLS